jgi:hypothetical protein
LQIKGAYGLAVAPNMQEALQSALIKSFETHEPLLIPGGWAGSPSGHAIYYEVIPQNDGTATFRLFNTGEGIQEHPRFQVGVKDKVGYLEWRNISKERLLNPYFSRCVVEMRSFPYFRRMEPNGFNLDPQVKKTDYNARDVYGGLKDLLKVRVEDTGDAEAILETSLVQAQRSGTCGYRSLLAFFKSKMDQGEFRRFKCDIALHALSAQMFLADSTTVDTRLWRLRKRGAGHLSRKINHLYQKKMYRHLLP